MAEPTQRKKVMIVDDSEIVLAVVRGALESAGFDVVTHPRPAGCLALILQELPDLLLIDVNMPGLNGDTVVKMLGSAQVESSMVILLHSSLQDDILAQKAKDSHAHGYVRKSENAQDLIRQVAQWVKPPRGSGAYQLNLDPSGASRVSSGKMLAARRVSDAVESAPPRPSGAVQSDKKLLLVDHEMVALSEYRHLTKSLQERVEYALSGAEALRRIQSECPPDVVILGRLVGTPSVGDVLREASRVGTTWKSRFIVLHDGTDPVGPDWADIVHLRRPISESSLCRAIQGCLDRAS